MTKLNTFSCVYLGELAYLTFCCILNSQGSTHFKDFRGSQTYSSSFANFKRQLLLPYFFKLIIVSIILQ